MRSPVRLPVLFSLPPRLRGGDVAVEAEEVVGVVAVFEGDEALPVFFWRVGCPGPVLARRVGRTAQAGPQGFERRITS